MKSCFSSLILPLFLLLTSLSGFAKTATFTILTFNDVYQIVPDQLGRGGFAEMMTLLKEEKKSAPYSITTVNGDFLSPCILSVFDKGAHRIELFNMMEIDVVSLGNHEFDFGPEVVLQRISESKFPWLAANAIGLDGMPFTGNNQTLLFDVDGFKVGMFGLITVETPELSSTEKKVCFSPLVYTAKQMIAELKKQGAEVIVVLTHLLMEEDKQLAEEVPEIDVILGGHDHDPITWYNDRTFIHKSGQNADYLARIDLLLEKLDGMETRVFPSWKVILNKGTSRDPIIGSKIDELQKVLETITSEELGVMEMTFDTLYTNVRSKENLFGNLVADALLEGTGADVAILSGGIIRGNRFYKPGDAITLKDLLTELPFGNQNVVIEVPGSAILASLENGVSQVEGKAGRFPQVSGLSFSFDIDAAPGQRIQEVWIQEKPLDLEKIYKVATVDYMLHGGDGYSMFKEGKILLSPLKKVDLVGTLASYMKKMPSIQSHIEGRIVVKGSAKKLDQITFAN